jgi:hypothetical protein
MDPFSRKLFTTRDAREHLRSMGGILSSSPRLAETVAKFNLGGDVIAPVVGASQEPALVVFSGSNFAVFPDGRVVNTDANVEVDDTQDPGGDLRRAVQALVSSEAPRSRSFRQEDAAMGEFGGLPSEMLSQRGTVPESVPGQGIFPSDIAFGVGEVMGLRPALEAAGIERPSEVRAADRAAEAAEAQAPKAEPEAGAEAQAAAEASDSDLASAERERQAAAQRAAEEMRRGGGENGEVIDFDTTFDQMLSRLERVMGTKDENSRQKAMANLAMIGLAIAAGQSPDALTNIAQGALTGMQAIRKEEAAEEAAQREMRLTALQMASAEVDSRRKLANALQIAGLRSGGRDPYTRERMRQQLVVAITNRINDFPQVQNPDGSINPQSLNATVESLLEAGVLPEDLSESDKALIGAGG